MADSKITALTELSAIPEDTDLVAIVDDPSGTPTTKKITVQNLKTMPMIVLKKSSTVNQDVGGANGTETWITWDGEDLKDSNYTHSTSTNSERVTVAVAGWYEIIFLLGAQTTGSSRTTLQGIYRVNGGTTSRGGGLRNYTRGSTYGNMTTGILYTLQLSASDYIEVGTRVEDTDGTYTINTSGGEISDDCHQLVIKKVR